MENESLQHWGIKGMRWGIRRFQNKDGSLTPAGKKRREEQDGDADGESKPAAPKKRTVSDMSDDELNKAINRARLEDTYASLRPDSGDKKSTKKKSVSDMSDEELRAALQRARDEEAYKQLRPEKQPFFKRVMESTLNDVIAPAAVASGKKFLTDALNKMGDKILKDEEDPNSIKALTAKRDKLKLLDEINKYKNKKADDDVNWDARDKKYEHEKKVAKDEAEAKAAKEAEKKAQNEAKAAEKKAREDAKAAKKAEEERRAKIQQEVDDYNKRWQAGEFDPPKAPKGDATYKTPYDKTQHIVPDSSTTSLTVSKSTNSSAKSFVAGLLGDGTTSSAYDSDPTKIRVRKPTEQWWKDDSSASSAKAKEFVDGLFEEIFD